MITLICKFESYPEVLVITTKATSKSPLHSRKASGTQCQILYGEFDSLCAKCRHLGGSCGLREENLHSLIRSCVFKFIFPIRLACPCL